MRTRLPPLAEIDWSDGPPRDRRTGDIYFNADGLAETRHVFLDGCGLPGAWAGRRQFAIGETGFGLGLNFLAAAALFRETAAPEARLHYLGFEARPPSAADIRRAHAGDALARDGARLADLWPPPLTGWSRLWLNDQTCLTLVIGDAAETLAQAPDTCIDAWFLDGFAPARDGGLWAPRVLGEIARMARPGAVAASFTAAGDVRRALEAHGFAVDRRPGYGAKRHCIAARNPGEGGDPPAPASVAIRGAGVAGVSAAAALRRRGITATIAGGDGASSAPFALVTPRLDVGEGFASDFYPAAWRYALRFWAVVEGWEGAPVHRLAANDDHARKFEKLASVHALPPEQMQALDAAALSDALGVAVSRGGLAFPPGGRIAASAALRALRRDWPAEAATDAVTVQCLGAGAASGPLAGLLSLRRGQMTAVETHAITLPPDRAVVFGHWLGSDQNGRRWLGASFERDTDRSLTPDPRVDGENISALDQALPGWRDERAAPRDAFAGLRATTADRHPIMGRLEDGDWALTGLGARGFSTAPLLGEALADLICGTPPPLPHSALAGVAPDRFATRAERRRAGQPDRGR